jgi:type-F conjugative transfer system pilin assembly protein TrbC
MEEKKLLRFITLFWFLLWTGSAVAADVDAVLELGMQVHEKNLLHLQEEGRKLAGGDANNNIQKYVFISFSMPETALKEIVSQAKVEGFTPVMRGFFEGSHKKTVLKLNEIIKSTDGGVAIDPEIFKEFSVTRVPTFLITDEKAKPCLPNTSCAPRKHHRLSGHVTVKYAHEKLLKAMEAEK